MHIVATVIKADTLFDFAEDIWIADYPVIRGMIFDGDADNCQRHRLWFRSCFTIYRGALPDWLPQVKEMVLRYMVAYDIEVLFIATGSDAHLIKGRNP